MSEARTPDYGLPNFGCPECHVAGGHYPLCPNGTVEIDEDAAAQAAFLRSLGLDPETATLADLEGILPPATDQGATS